MDKKIATAYSSASQRARVLTEEWVSRSIFCPNCGRLKISRYGNNRPVADFYCINCREEYELKSNHTALHSRIVDGAYSTMIARLKSAHNPNFFLLHYEVTDLCVKNFMVIPKHFFVPGMIEMRKPLAITARRAGWVGCNILISKIPESGKIFFVQNGRTASKEKVITEWKKTLFLREERAILRRGWLLDIMRCIDGLQKREFVLEDIYAHEKNLARLHPENLHIKDKIRQQLQILRDKNYLKFSSRGQYQLV